MELILAMQKATLYIDESGKSSLLSDEKEPFIITGVILGDQEAIAVEGFFTYIKRKYGIDILWSEIRKKKGLREIKGIEIKDFFGIRGDGVYKALK